MGAEQKNDTFINVLFVGNSLTFYNDLPILVANEAKSRGLELKTTLLAYPNYAILDHWEDGKVQKMIATGKYDYVIIQQGPSSQADGRAMLLEYGKKFKQVCSENEAQLAYFMVWPSRTYYYTFEAVITNHRESAKKNDALLLPVGEVWKNHFDATGDFSYYGSDGFHPSLAGSKVAAQVICEALLK